MPDEMYSDTPGEESPSPAPEKDNESEEGETALLPKSILAGKKFEVGEEVIFKIVHEYDDEIEVEYAHDESKENESENPDMAAAHSEMDKMAY